ncbi:MAG: hypothetical protein ABT02_07905 [Comamonadaceae bacterium SCN 68-20]|nr:acetoacetate decarboxylase family protein [Comamonadaceae bacterium]ODU60049.1 MAG: hypothetical protein ABT02_07905 [Comamonadaceae bacterium SCN 68-20]OJX36516.1 MAG: hypothetical protein BGO75_14465 [Burkholderiales bacterium 68-20]
MFSNIAKGLRALRRYGVLQKGPWWTNARMVFADVPLEYEVVKEWVPFPLTIPKQPVATVFMAHYPHCAFGVPYLEVGVMVQVKLFGIFPMLHCPWMLVDDDLHLINGRELLGYPKKMAQMEFEEKDGRFVGSATRRGQEVFRIEGTIGKSLTNPRPGAGQWWINMRHMLTFFPGHLVAFRPQETVHHANEMPDIKVTFSPSEFDPIGHVTGPARHGSIRTCDFTGNITLPPLRVWPVGPFFQSKLLPLRTR